MLADISAGYGSLKAAVSIVQGLNATHTQVQINDVKIELQRLMLDAQSALMGAQASEAASASRISGLEQQIVQFEAWDSEKQRYELKGIDRGVFAYMLKAGMDEGEPPHWLCANCFQKRHKGFLQFKGQDLNTHGRRADTSTYGCDTCKSTVKVGYRVNPSGVVAE